MNGFLLKFLEDKNWLKLIFNSWSTDGKTIFWLNSKKRSIDVMDKLGNKVGEYRMLYREIACNWLLCAVLDYIYPWFYHSFKEDDWDGTITGNGLEIATEHILAYDYWNKIVKYASDLEELVAESILKKLKKGGSFETWKIYLKNKTLVVNVQFPKNLEVNIASIINQVIQNKPIFTPVIYIIWVHKEIDQYNFIFNITRIVMNWQKITTFHVDLDLQNEKWSVRLFK